jgi:bacillopeptidase F
LRFSVFGEEEMIRAKSFARVFLGVALAIGLGYFAALASITPELEARLAQAHPGEKIAVIVALKERFDLSTYHRQPSRVGRPDLVRGMKNMAERSQAPLRRFLAGERVGRNTQLWLINAMAVEIEPKTIRRLAGQPWVSRVQLDYSVRLPELQLAAAVPGEWNIETIGAPQVWSLGYTGQGVVVATMDSGADRNHPDLAGSYRGGSNSWFDPYGEHLEPYDADGHGTQVLGVLVGGSFGGTAIGVAPDAQWIAVKIFRDAGTADLSRIHQGFQWLLDPDGDPSTDDAPDIVNNSWFLSGTENVCNLEFEADIAALKAADIAVVFAGGNTGPNAYSSVSPANNPSGFAVGGLDEFDNAAFFSGRGPSACGGSLYPQVAAPAARIRTADLTFGLPVAFYIDVSGTSFAAPHVAGAMALLKGAFKDLTVPELEAAVQKGARDLGDPGPDHEFGYGLLDVLESYQTLAADACTCDLNQDGRCDRKDRQIFLKNWRRSECRQGAVACACDLNQDGRCNFQDRRTFMKDWGREDCRIQATGG